MGPERVCNFQFLHHRSAAPRIPTGCECCQLHRILIFASGGDGTALQAAADSHSINDSVTADPFHIDPPGSFTVFFTVTVGTPFTISARLTAIAEILVLSNDHVTLLETNNPWEILAIAYLFFVPGLGFLLEKRPLILLVRRGPWNHRGSFILLSPLDLHVVGTLLVSAALLLAAFYVYTHQVMALNAPSPGRSSS